MNQFNQFFFGSGTLVMKRTDITAPPVLIGTLQDISVDLDRKIEGLLGQYNVVVALGGGEMKISGKAKFAKFDSSMLNNLFLNQAQATAGMEDIIIGEAVTAPGATTFTVNKGTAFQDDLGLYYGPSTNVGTNAPGVQLTPLTTTATTTSTAGTYIPGVAGTGAYGIASADDALAFTVNYAYNLTTGVTVQGANQFMGTLPTFALYMRQSFNYLGTTKELVLKLNACSSSKISLAFNQQKFVIPEFDFQAQADANNNWGTVGITQ